MGVNISPSGDGTNWTLLITTTPTGLTTSAVKLTITTGGGANTVVNNIAFASLTAGNWNTNKAQFIGSGGTTIIVGDRVLVSTTSYPAGYQVLIADSQGILYSHALSETPDNNPNPLSLLFPFLLLSDAALARSPYTYAQHLYDILSP